MVSAEVRAESLESGADLYLDKPVLLRQLSETVEALLSQHPHGGP